jgi:TP901 family phage tail tape measure protein
MAKSKEYELAVKIAAKLDPSFNTNLSKAGKDVESFGTKVSAAASKALKVGMAAASAFAGAAAAATAVSIKNAIAYESSMADVAKVVDGLRDSSGNLTSQYYEMKDSLLELSTQIPMTAEELTQIAAAAGQSGIARDEIISFAESAAKMGIAFDTTADQAGEWMAKWRTSFQMSQKDVVALSDQINYLSNNSAANAVQISSIVTEVGPLGQVAGLTAAQIAALGDTMVGVGIGEDVAATGIKKMATTMTAGSSATKKQQAVLSELGISATDLAQRMQTDAQGAILDFLSAVQKLPAAEQAAALKNFFGQESVGAIAPLLTNLPELQKHFDMVADAAQYAGSMEDEYASRSATTGNSIELAKNALYRLSVVYGEMFAPYVKIAADKATEFLNKLSDMRPQMEAAFSWIVAHGPEVAASISTIATAIGGLWIAGKLGQGDGEKGFDFKKLFSTKSVKSNIDNLVLQFANAGKKVHGFGGSILSYFNGVKGGVAKLRLGDAFKTLGAAFKNTKLGGVASGLFSSLTGKASGMLGGLKTALSSGFAKALSGIKSAPLVTGITKMFTSAGGKISNVIGKVLSNPFVGGLTKVFGGIAGRLPALGGLISTALGPIGGILSTILTGALPIVAVIGTVIALFSIFKDHLGDIRGAIQNTFGDKGVAVFDGFINVAKGIADKIKGFFSPENLASIQQTITTMFGPEAGAAFGGLSQIIQSVIGVVQQLVTFSETYVKPIILNLWQLITTTILPGIMSAFAAAAPYISGIISGLGSTIMTVATMIAQGIQAIWPVIQFIVQAMMNVVQVVGPAVLAGISSVVQSISGIFSGLQTMFQGLIDFVTGVFTGNWQQAWDGVKQIFSGAFSALVELCKMPINMVISIINAAISGINSLGLTIPDWVPFIGGKSFSINIPTIPMLAAGGIATRATQAVIGEGAEDEAVLPLSKLDAMLQATRTQQAQTTAATALTDAQRNAPRAPALAFADDGSQGGPAPQGETWNGGAVSYSPQIIIQGNADQNDVQNALAAGFEEFKKYMKQYQKENRRTAFA